jgi:pimeloyl-ACP methyl ester carboxylesterase
MNDGVRIYYEREGHGPPIVLHHGFSLSLDTWRGLDFVSALRDDYELILIDARGHGQSDKPHHPDDYTLDKRVADVTAVLDHASVERPVFWGDAMGGDVGYALLRYAPERFRAMVIGGAQPSRRDPALSASRAEMLRRLGMAGYLAYLEQIAGWPFPEPGRSQILRNDSDALTACDTAMGDAPDFAEAVVSAPIPVLVYCGEREVVYADAQRSAAGKQNVTFIGLPGFGHVRGGRCGDCAMTQILTFLAGVQASGVCTHPRATQPG